VDLYNAYPCPALLGSSRCWEQGVNTWVTQQTPSTGNHNWRSRPTTSCSQKQIRRKSWFPATTRTRTCDLLASDQWSNDQQIFIISHGETSSHSCWAPFVVEVRIEPNTFRPVNPTLYQLSYLPHLSSSPWPLGQVPPQHVCCSYGDVDGVAVSATRHGEP
jgi:hypothetical protein